MKKLCSLIFTLVIFSLILFSCQKEPHEHTFSKEWTSNETFHWHAATCEHKTQVSDRLFHVWDNGKVTKPADCSTSGEILYTCIFCNEQKTEVVYSQHSYSEDWTNDETYHWHAASCEHTHKINDKAKHIWKLTATIVPATISTKGEGKYTCTVCKRNKTDEIPKLYPLPVYSIPIDVESGEEATKDSTYVYFGIFPKTVLAAESSVTIDETESFSIGANTYYKGSDEEWYVKVTAKPYSSYQYSDGTTVTSTERYFKVEPVKWKVLTTDYNGTGKALLFAEDILTANVPYYADKSNRTIGGKTIYANNYKYSTIRAYLNGKFESDDTQSKTVYTDKGFLQTAFVAEAQTLIAETEVINDGDSTSDSTGSLTKADGSDSSYTTDYTCANTTDKIFLLSEQEITTNDYGFAGYSSYGTGNARIRITTDYAKANYAYQDSSTGYGCWWWLRSPSFSCSYYARNIRPSGLGDYYNDTVSNMDDGVVPALTILLK